MLYKHKYAVQTANSTRNLKKMEWKVLMFSGAVTRSNELPRVIVYPFTGDKNRPFLSAAQSILSQRSINRLIIFVNFFFGISFVYGPYLWFESPTHVIDDRRRLFSALCTHRHTRFTFDTIFGIWENEQRAHNALIKNYFHFTCICSCSWASIRCVRVQWAKRSAGQGERPFWNIESFEWQSTLEWIEWKTKQTISFVFQFNPRIKCVLSLHSVSSATMFSRRLGVWIWSV